MDNKKIIKVKITGSDYTPISQAKVIFDDKFEYNNSDNDAKDFFDSTKFWKHFSIEGKPNSDNEQEKLKKEVTKFVEKVLNTIDKNMDAFIVNTRKSAENDTEYKDNKLYEYYGNECWFGGYVGIISFERTLEQLIDNKLIDDKNVNEIRNIKFKIILQIQSRFDKNENKEFSEPYFLTTMLSRKLDLTKETVPIDEESLFDYLLLYWFRSTFMDATEKGFYRTYRRFEKNDDRLKGSIDIARHIKLNVGQHNGKIAYSYRENTADNFINALIIRAYECLKRKYYDAMVDNFDNYNDGGDYINLKNVIDNLKSQISDINLNDSYLLGKNVKSIAHPFYSEYEKLRKICIMILRDEGINFFDGTLEDDVEGVLFYIPDLWEMYLEKKLGGNLDRESNIELSTQDSTGNNVVNVFGCKGQNEYKYKQTTRPDFIFKTQGESFMILDAKFKPAWYEAMYRGKLGKQLLPDFDKCIRDMVGSGCYATGVIFPTNNEYGEIKEQKHTISKDAEDKMFYTISVNVPRVEETEYEKWAKKFNNSIDILKNQVLTILNKEKEIYLEVKEKKEELSNRIKTLREN